MFLLFHPVSTIANSISVDDTLKDTVFIPNPLICFLSTKQLYLIAGNSWREEGKKSK